MISLNSPPLLSLNQSRQIETEVKNSRCISCVDFSHHKQWNHESGWKNTLNNLRLIVQPLLLLWLIYPWLDIFPNSNLLLGFNHLISLVIHTRPQLITLNCSRFPFFWHSHELDVVPQHIFRSHRFVAIARTPLARAIPASEILSNNNLSINSRVTASTTFFCGCSTNVRPHSWQRNLCLPL